MPVVYRDPGVIFVPGIMWISVKAVWYCRHLDRIARTLSGRADLPMGIYLLWIRSKFEKEVAIGIVIPGIMACMRW